MARRRGRRGLPHWRHLCLCTHPDMPWSAGGEGSTCGIFSPSLGDGTAHGQSAVVRRIPASARRECGNPSDKPSHSYTRCDRGPESLWQGVDREQQGRVGVGISHGGTTNRGTGMNREDPRPGAVSGNGEREARRVEGKVRLRDEEVTGGRRYHEAPCRRGLTICVVQRAKIPDGKKRIPEEQTGNA